MTNTELNEIFREYKQNLPFSRLGTTFKTANNFYYYDLGTGKVLQCSKAVYMILFQLEKSNVICREELKLSDLEILDAINDIQDAIQNEHIFLAPIATTFTNEATEALDQCISNLQLMCLETTERCNLRCDYCIYHEHNSKFREYGNQDMSWETAQKAIDYFLSHADPNKAYFAFYGGEPLLKFDLIRKCVDYIQKNNSPNRELHFTLTTNGTLMTTERAKYFASIPFFTLVFSIDGDQETHNEHRRDALGNGSFHSAYEGFENAVNAFGKSAIERISINSVVSPPYSDEKLNRMQAFFDEKMDGILKLYSYVEYEREDYETMANEFKERSLEAWQPIYEWQKRTQRKDNEVFTWEPTVKSLLQIHKRPISEYPTTNYKFNGCCAPGGRKLYVTVAGHFKICERVGECPEIGDINNGLDLHCIQKKYIDEYIDKSLPDCKKCWAINLCGQCYATCYGPEGINVQKKKMRCEEQRFGIRQNLVHYHELLEENPDELLFLNDRHML